MSPRSCADASVLESRYVTRQGPGEVGLRLEDLETVGTASGAKSPYLFVSQKRYIMKDNLVKAKGEDPY